MFYFSLLVTLVSVVLGLITMYKYTLGELFLFTYILAAASDRVLQGQTLWLNIPMALLAAFLVGVALKKVFRKEWVCKK